jgi:hypothetical protein
MNFHSKIKKESEVKWYTCAVCVGLNRNGEDIGECTQYSKSKKWTNIKGIENGWNNIPK